MYGHIQPNAVPSPQMVSKYMIGYHKETSDNFYSNLQTTGNGQKVHLTYFHLHKFQGSEQVMFLTPTPGLAPSPNLYTASAPMAPAPMQFPAQPPPQVTGISVSKP